MNVVRRVLRVFVICGTVSLLLILSACYTVTETPSAETLLFTPAQTGVFCDLCALETQAAALTQEKINADNQAAATAEIARADAQTLLNSANATLGAALTQEQNKTNVIAAQITATADIANANAQATLNSAASTQSAALTQDAIHQTQTADFATTNAQAILNQQNEAKLVASTQTALANIIATQTQSAVATAQWYTDQTRQREEERQAPISFLWMWCLPMFLVLLAGLILWGLWRWLKIQQANQHILEAPVDRLPAAAEIIDYQEGDSPYLESDIADSQHQLANPEEQVDQWLDEVKDKLLRSDEKDEDDNTDN